MFVIVDEKKFPSARAIDGRASPGSNVLSRCAPDFSPIFDTESGDKGAFLHIALEKYLAFENDWRTSEAPLGGRDHEESGVQQTEVLLPEQLSLHVITEEALRPEHSYHMLTIGRRSGTGVGRLRVAFDLGNPSEGNSLPEDLSRTFVQTINNPFMTGVILNWSYVTVKTHSELGVCLSAYGGSYEEIVPPDNRAGMAETGDRRFPLDVLAGRHIPFGWSRKSLGDATGIRASEGRPMNFRRNRIA